MIHRYTLLYEYIFKSIKNILTQNNNYELELNSITTEAEEALIKSINNTFDKYQYILCYFHYKQNLLQNVREFGLFNQKNKNLDFNNTKFILRNHHYCLLNIKVIWIYMIK